MKTKKYRKMENMLKDILVYKKILEIRNDEKAKTNLKNINKAMSCLNEIEKTIINDYYVNGMNMLEIAEKINLTREYTSKVKTTAIRKLGHIILGEDDNVA